MKRKFLAAYLAVEAAIHDSLSLFAAVTLIVAGNQFGWVLIAWAASELIIKATASYALWPAATLGDDQGSVGRHLHGWGVTTE